MSLLWLARARRDLESVVRFILQHDPAAARRVRTKVDSAAQALRRHPRMGRPGRVSGTRELVVVGLPYIVVYRLKGDRIEILRVLHTRRRWPDET